MNGAGWARWQAVAVAGIAVLAVYATTIWAGTEAAGAAGMPSLVGALAGLGVGYVLSSCMLRWVLAHTVMRQD